MTDRTPKQDVGVRLVVPPKMRSTIERLQELQAAAAAGDRHAQKILKHARNYSCGPSFKRFPDNDR